MGSFTQGGIAFGQSIGGGIENYAKGRERRELLVGKALGIANMLQNDEKRSDEDNKYLKKFDDVNELGTRQLQSLISEFETGEELQIMGMKRKILQSQVDDVEAKAKSRQGLADFTSKGMPATEANFEGTGDYKGAIPTWAQREQLSKGEAYPVFPGELNPIYEEQRVTPSPFVGQMDEATPSELNGNPYLEQIERRRAEDDQWMRAPNAEAIEAIQNSNLQGATNLGVVDSDGNVRFSQKTYDDMFSPAALSETERQRNNSYYRKKLDQTIETIADMESRSSNPSSSFAWYDEELKNKSMFEDLIESTSQQQALPTEENPWPRAQASEEGLDPLVIPNTVADIPLSQPKPEVPVSTEQKLVGYDVKGGRDTPASGDFDRMLTGGTPDTPMDERRGQLIDSLAQYGLTPADRKQAIDMISEKYPKLKEFATTVITAGGEEIGYNVNGTIIKKQKVGTPPPQGWRAKSRSVNAAGEETVVYEDPTKLPTHVPTASSYASSDPELTLKESNAPSEGQAKEFNTSAAAAKQVSADCKFLVDATKDASFFNQRLTDFKFKAKVNTIIATMKGKLRPLLIGPGAMSDIEQKMLSSALPDPGDFFRLDTATIQRFETLGELVDKKVKYHGEAIGLWDYKPIGEGGQSGVGGTADELGIL